MFPRHLRRYVAALPFFMLAVGPSAQENATILLDVSIVPEKKACAPDGYPLPCNTIDAERDLPALISGRPSQSFELETTVGDLELNQHLLIPLRIMNHYATDAKDRFAAYFT